jgi:hypothetical protein
MLFCPLMREVFPSLLIVFGEAVEARKRPLGLVRQMFALSASHYFDQGAANDRFENHSYAWL